MKKKDQIIYYDDFNCNPRLMKVHSVGFKNIYSVEAVYLVEGTGKNVSIKRDYGCFPVAYSRFQTEVSSGVPFGKRLVEVNITVTTYSDIKVVHSETMKTISLNRKPSKDIDQCKKELMYGTIY